MNNSYITIIKEKRTVLSRKRVPLNQNECTADFRIGVPFEQNLQQYGNNEVLYNKEKANRTRYYWDLKDDIHLYDDNGKELEGRSPVGNIYFWQKWQ